jgi:hypothetical protein
MNIRICNFVCREKKSRIEKEAKPKQEKDSEND